MKFSSITLCSGYINKHWYIEQEPESACMGITKLVTEHVKDEWKLYIVDAPSYKRFNSFRGVDTDKAQVMWPAAVVESTESAVRLERPCLAPSH